MTRVELICISMGACPASSPRTVEWHDFISALMAAVDLSRCAMVLFLAEGPEAFGVEAVPFCRPLSLRWIEIPGCWLSRQRQV